ncbi:hypothetical protein [endosymbiont GvMRE of Glomus versiforme]|uniref:DNA-directed RNA polymerase subunit beta n=1 Tax=endosymbiont GvMRE of Glomus versiforme TaxID=2039283 RepID=UPI000EDBB28A|nr:hypothetical protein [endosymbiont GvMRE of Glomus versiforme]RHZ35466.1 DNA-directed RNA polymerase subunit beta [endosymbiont GvMRE of Glomus versiforme]
MSSYRIIKSGKNQRREYLGPNHSPLFQNLPDKNFAQERKKKYNDLFNRLSKLIHFYFPEKNPIEFSDYNNKIKIEIKNIECQELTIKKKIGDKEIEVKVTEEEARDNFLTWSNAISFFWKVIWDCERIREVKLPSSNLKECITQWIEESFKIEEFTCERKVFSSSELTLLLTQTKKELREFLLDKEQKKKKSHENISWRLTNKIKSLENNEYEEWEIKELESKDKKLRITLEILEKRQDSMSVGFRYEQTAKVIFCHLPKMNSCGNFIINGHDKVVVFQSVRAPSIYFFTNEANGFYGEIIPLKGSWIRIFRNVKKPRAIELKFLNSKLVVDLLEIFKSFSVTQELLENLFSYEDLNIEDYQKTKPLETGKDGLPNFLFTNYNSYFTVGKLGRKKINEKVNILKQASGQVLAEDIYNSKGRLLLKKNTLLAGKELKLLQNFLNKDELVGISIPHSTNVLYIIKIIKSSQDQKVIEEIKTKIAELEKSIDNLALTLSNPKIPIQKIENKTDKAFEVVKFEMEEEVIELKKQLKQAESAQKTISIITSKDLPEEKKYFDLADLICIVSSYINLHHGLGKTEKDEDKDNLTNQVVRSVEDLVYNIFDNKLGSFLQDIDNKYLAKISQLKKADLLAIPNLKDFDNIIKTFFNDSALVQLQNQNNPLAEISYIRKLSVLGLGGFSSANTTLAARNINPSYYGRYDLIETPEGQKVGLIHNLTIGAEINNYGQITAPYYLVQNGVISPQLVHLTSEEEWNKYIVHANIKIDEENRILEETLLARYQGDFLKIKKEKVNYIDSSFYQLNSVTSATIPFFHHNDSTRMLMATNMQRQAVILLKSEEPLITSGIESNLLNNSSFVIKAQEGGTVEYADNKHIIIKEDNNKKEKYYELKQLIVSNKNVLSFSQSLVKKGEIIEKGQIIASGNYANNEELSLGYNLRVAYLCWEGYNYEDAIIISERLVKEDIFTSFFVKKHTIVRRNTKYGPETFTSFSSSLEKSKFSHLDEEGIVKLGTRVKGNDILVGKLTPEPSLQKETEEELLLMNILGEKTRRFVNSSLFLPSEEKGFVYDIKRKNLNKKEDELELVEIYVAQKRKIEPGDKLTTRFGNKGVVAKIVPEVNMPFDEEGETIDIIFNPLGIPTRMNLGQLLETILAKAAHKLNKKFLVRPFSTLSLETIKEIIEEAGIENWGSQRLFDGKTGLPFRKNIYNGYIYTIKLNHMTIDKLHTRNTGPYSLIYQQPLKGRSQEGGQRIGEMEAWVLEAHGAAYNLMEMMSAKSDDIYKKRLTQNALLFDNRKIDLRNSQSESFNLLLQYLRGIGFDLRATDYQGKEIDFYETFSKKNK